MLATRGGMQILVLNASPNNPVKGDTTVLRLGNNLGETIISELLVYVTRRESAEYTAGTLFYIAGRVSTESVALVETLLEGSIRPNIPIYFVMKYNPLSRTSDSIRFGVVDPVNMTTPELEAITI